MNADTALREKGDFTRPGGRFVVGHWIPNDRCCGPTMNAFGAAAKSGRAGAPERGLGALFVSQNASLRPDATSIPATYLRVAVTAQ
ncbi:MAG TPA: hypothetical protein VMM27_16765 [Casimicrobiaceae bacterium]|nr:hypothetical protein [Casimicrobiaceae bacterium]